MALPLRRAGEWRQAISCVCHEHEDPCMVRSCQELAEPDDGSADQVEMARPQKGCTEIVLSCLAVGPQMRHYDDVRTPFCHP